MSVFWTSHDPTAETWNRQYRNAIFTLNAQQKEAADASMARIARETRSTIHTAIEAATPFTRAEIRHQKYYLRQAEGVLAELSVYYPNGAELTDSIAATRINGYLGCAGNLASLRQEIDTFGLTPASRLQLLAYVGENCHSDDGPTCGKPPP